MGHLGFTKPHLNELWSPRNLRDSLMEFVLCALMNFTGTAVSLPFLPSDDDLPTLRLGLAAGFIVFTFIEAFGHVNFAHFNPSVTTMFVITKKMSILKGLMYLAGQMSGSVAGVGLLYLCLPDDMRDTIKPVHLNDDLHPAQGLVVEWLITTTLLFVIMGVFDSSRRPLMLSAISVGFTVFANIQGAAHLTGGCMNPIVAFGPAVISGIWDNHWIYWVGDILGSITGTLMYTFFTWDGGPFKLPEESSDQKHKTAENTNRNGIPPGIKGTEAPWNVMDDEATQSSIYGTNTPRLSQDVSRL